MNTILIPFYIYSLYTIVVMLMRRSFQLEEMLTISFLIGERGAYWKVEVGCLIKSFLRQITNRY